MEERKKNLCAMIPESLHKKVREEQEEFLSLRTRATGWHL